MLLAEETAGHLRGQQFALKVATPDPLGANAQMLHVELSCWPCDTPMFFTATREKSIKDTISAF